MKIGSTGKFVRMVQRWLARLGYAVGDADGDFGPRTDAAVREFQRGHQLKVDGVVGPITSTALEEAAAADLRHAEREAMMDELERELGDEEPSLPFATDSPSRSALAFALEQWEIGIREPPGENWDEIDKFIRDGLGWRRQRYTRNRSFAWCGAFVAWCYRQAGLSAEVRRQHMASTYRLWAWGRETRAVQLTDIQPGDIVVVGRPSGKRWGAHITMCDHVGDGWAHTVEGNARGVGPDGSRFEGVIRQRRPLPGTPCGPREYRVMFAYRFKPEDFA